MRVFIVIQDFKKCWRSEKLKSLFYNRKAVFKQRGFQLVKTEGYGLEIAFSSTFHNFQDDLFDIFCFGFQCRW